jgi:drug/metabolite transporter (DMT)-like permease
MIYLLIATIIWGFSFGLIKNNLAGVDPIFVSFCRMGLAFAIFLPFLQWKKLKPRLSIRMILIGSLQFGAMYICYTSAFQFLKAYEVALFTIFTPLFVTLFDGTLRRRLSWLFLATSLMTVVGTAIVEYQQLTSPTFWQGFILVQLSNLAFAIGQILYRREFEKISEVRDVNIFGFLYLGGVLLTGIAAAFFSPWSKVLLNPTRAWSLIYLGIVASGIGFFLWNLGARKINVGALAIANDLKIPVAILISLVIFRETTDLPRLLLGGSIVILALVTNEWMLKREGKPVV